MKEYFVMINDEKIIVSKEIYDVYNNVNGESRRYQYTEKLAVENEISYENLEERGFVIENNLKNDIESLESKVINKIIFEKAVQIINKLTYEEKEIITQIYFENVSEVKLADKIGISRTTLQSKKYKILKKIKKILEK